MAFMSPSLRAAVVGLFAIAGALASPAQAQVTASLCGPLQNAYGPFDYRTHREKLSIVENFHFTPEVEALIKGKSGSLGGDIDYTLRASPNHHRALLALMRLSERTADPQPAALPRPLECYFERALRFQHDDPVARMIYARFLAFKNRREEAANQLTLAASHADRNPLTHYNVGLIYMELKDYARALEQAHKALALGLTRTALKEQLQAAGHWREPVLPEQARPSSAAASSAAR